jgi:hypothetical protein
MTLSKFNLLYDNNIAQSLTTLSIKLELEKLTSENININILYP